MKARTKQRLVVLGLALFATWPLVHRGIVARYDTSPWRLFGWAMYCVPMPRYLPMGVRVATLDARGEVLSERRRGLGIGRFVQRRRVLGRLHPPHAVGDVALRLSPEAVAVRIDVTRRYLDSRTARIAERTDTYEYAR